jgi:2-dehydro-3-deoxyphosphogluconate aldolase / (4S)-4-hydroxy-2-oxoglutarate aldolase
MRSSRSHIHLRHAIAPQPKQTQVLPYANGLSIPGGLGSPRPPDSGAWQQLCHVAVIPVVEVDSAEEVGQLASALTLGGLPVAEITLRTDAAIEAIATLRRSHPSFLTGAGTVRTATDAVKAIRAGAQFIVSPATDSQLIKLCRSLGVEVISGACTPTEIESAVRAGSCRIKFFPAEASGGVAFLKALAGPYREVSFVPTGGINSTNLASYLHLPHVAACGGSWMAPPRLIRERRFDEIRLLAREAVAIAEGVRKHA